MKTPAFIIGEFKETTRYKRFTFIFEEILYTFDDFHDLADWFKDNSDIERKEILSILRNLKETEKEEEKRK